MQRQKTPSGNFLVTSFTSSTGPNSDNNNNNNNMPSAATAAAAYDPMSQVLATFSCPRDCHLFEASYREMINCPFGHSPNSTGQQQLKKVPPAACIRSLLGECEKTVKKRVVDLLSGATISNSQSSGSSSSLNKLTHATDSLTIAQCSEGVHFSVEQLVDLEHFYEQNTAANLARIQATEEGETTGGEVTIAATTSSNGNNNSSQQQQAPPQLPVSSVSSSSQQSRASVAIRDRECAICLLSMAEGQPLGMLSQCVHVFCASCLINWFRSPPPPSLANLNRLQTCPVCRATSSFVLPWPRPLTGRAEKWTIFKLQHDALHMVSEQLAPHEGDEEEDGENGDGDEEDGENEDMEEEDNSGDTSNDEEHIDREGEGDSSSSSEEDI